MGFLPTKEPVVGHGPGFRLRHLYEPHMDDFHQRVDQ